MTEPNPQYTHKFVVETGNYGDFIRWVRQDVCKHCDNKRPRDIPPVLPPEKQVPNLWLHIVLRNLTLAIRMDNLYLVGFKTPAGVWWEFGKEGETRLIRNSRWLGFGGRYQDLVGQKGLETITLGRAEMIAAVDFLAKYGGAAAQVPRQAGQQGGDAYAQAKTMLAKLVIMVCEGLRFHTVYTTLDKEFDNPMAKITWQDGKQVLRWDRISKAILKWADNPKADPQLDQELGIKNRVDAAKVVALVKNETN